MNQLFAFHNKLPFAVSCLGSCSKNDDVEAVSSLCCACSHLLSVFHPMHRSVFCVPVDSVVPKWKKFETESSYTSFCFSFILSLYHVDVKSVLRVVVLEVWNCLEVFLITWITSNFCIM